MASSSIPNRGSRRSNVQSHGERVVERADVEALALKLALEHLAIPLGLVAAAFVAARAWFEFGYARASDHSRERFGRTGRWLADQAALGRAVEAWPQLARALSGKDGGRALGRVAATLIGRVACAETIDAWIAAARGMTVRELKAVIRAGAGPGVAMPESPDADLSVIEDCEVTRSVSVAVPAAVRVAFDEALALYRAVDGGESDVTAFVEALVAEGLAGAEPAHGIEGDDAVGDAVDRDRRIGTDAIERRLARVTDGWAALGRMGVADDARAASAAADLARFERIARGAGKGSVPELDRQLRELIELEDAFERRLGELLCRMGETHAWSRLSFAGVQHYAEERLGLRRTAVYHRTRLARALRRYPELREAYEGGRLGQEAVLVVLRILERSPADEELERAWLERAEDATVKRLRDEARAIARRRSSAEEDVSSPLSPLVPLDDAAWQHSLRHRAGDLRATVHRLCSHAVAGGEGSAPDALVQSDVFLRLRLRSDLARDFLAVVEASRRGLSDHVGRLPWDEAWPDPQAPASVRAARTFSVRGRRVPAWVGLMALLEDFVDTWDQPDACPDREAYAIYAREGWRCFAPGCTSRRHLEDHHVVYRSQGGDVADPANRVCLCRFHHQRGEHGGLASCRGRAPLGLTFRLGRPGVAEWFKNERRLTV